MNPCHTVHISEMFRLVRGTQHILDVLDVLHRDRLALRNHDGAFSAMDLTARHPRTGELLSAVKPAGRAVAPAGASSVAFQLGPAGTRRPPGRDPEAQVTAVPLAGARRGP